MSNENVEHTEHMWSDETLIALQERDVPAEMAANMWQAVHDREEAKSMGERASKLEKGANEVLEMSLSALGLDKVKLLGIGTVTLQERVNKGALDLKDLKTVLQDKGLAPDTIDAAYSKAIKALDTEALKMALLEQGVPGSVINTALVAATGKPAKATTTSIVFRKEVKK